MVELDRSNFGEEVLKEREKRVLLFFYALFDENCEKVNQLLEEAESEFSQVKFTKIDGEKEKMLAFNYQALRVPAIILLDKGEVIGSAEGVLSKENLKELITLQ